MADLVVRPAYQFGPTDILTADKLNLMGTPIVELSISDRVDDQSFLRNGNFYSSFWTNTTPAGISCPVGVETSNADYWTVNPNGAAVVCVISPTVPDLFSLFSMEVQGAAGATDVRMSQIINGDLSATLRRVCTFSGYIYNGAGLSVSPQLEIWTNNTFNNFNTLTFQQVEDIQTCAPGIWTYVSVTFDLTSVTNVANGLRITTLIPSGGLSATTKYILFSRIKFQIGELATEFVDDVGLFVQTPSVDSTMLQDGCIARPTLFLPNVIPIGTYEAKSIQNGDLGDGVVDGRTLVQSVTTTLTAAFTQPAVAATVSIAVTSTAGFRANQPINITGGGAYVISSVTDATDMVVTNSGGTGNAAPAALVPTGGAVHQASGVVENLGYVPVNKAGDSGIGSLQFVNDAVIGTTSYANGALRISSTLANGNNAGYMPAIGFERLGLIGRAIGLGTTGRFLAPISGLATQYYLLDSYFGVGTSDIQNGAVTIPKIGADVVAMVIPPGIIQMFSGPSPPAGWLVCNGQPISRTTFAALFSAIGTYWGVGDNSTTFNIPDFRGRSPLGYVDSGGSGLTARGFASKGGEENHSLQITELPSHNHGGALSDPGHVHGIHGGGHTHSYVNPIGTTIGVQGGGTVLYAPSGSTQTGSSQDTFGIDLSGTGAQVQAQGGNAVHNTLHPFAVLYFIIKY